MSKKNIAIVMGGYSGEYDVSMGSGQVVFDHLRNAFNCFKVIIAKDGWYADIDGEQFSINKHDFSFLGKNNTQVTFDGVFVAVHGTPAEDGLLPAYFELIGMPHSTSNAFASALTFNKAECNMVIRHMGITVPKSEYIHQNDSINSRNIIKKLGLPLFVKPNCSGSSLGVSKVKNADDFAQALNVAFTEDDAVVVESAVIGTEVACGVCKRNGKVTALAITEIVPKNEFFDYESKYSGLSEEITPARISEHAQKTIMAQTELVYKKLQLNGLARVDFIIDQNDVPHLIEVNTVPGLSAESILPKQAAYLNLDLGMLFAESLPL
ncbi:MAG: D-alanine--D-alanine ligase [Cryomorphaceae bacterium]|nr:D-alanine--D-alanine ligase [Cryomorphaceae bacterium]